MPPMTSDLLLGLIAYAFATSITPGPNNLMLMASGANYGFRRTLPHHLGVSLGFAAMAALVGLGLLQLFNAIPGFFTALKYACVAYLLYLAWKIATAGRAPSKPASGTTAEADAPVATGKPMTFVQAVLFQWVNPKAFVMAMTTVTAYAPEQDPLSIIAASLIFAAVNFPAVGCWVVLGTQLQRWLRDPGRLRVFNISMAVLLIASVIPVLL